MNLEETNRREAQIGQIINDYLDRRGRGESVSEDEIIQAHPALAEELQSHFELVRDMVVGAGSGLPEVGEGFSHLPHDSLPGYEILSEIHRGGQGVVYQALQKGTRRKVAIKVMREGPFAGWRDRARFDREVQILSTLKHPSIVSIHDSGVASGSHYFVMDYISGQPLDVYMSSGPRSIRQVLGLFVRICDAVNTAHLRGIIHRDLKPGNIRIDADGEPHVLDFGLAKLSSQPDHESQTMTASGQFVGSLPWASPEQAEGTLDKIDTRTDVYALGVVLYQVLTGRFPYEVVGPMREVLDRIVTAEPAKPSGLRAEIDNELEAILLKCLQKEAARRYQTAGEMGRELERYLHGEPITAKSDSGLYVLKKMIRRHRGPVAAAIAFVLLLGAGLVASLASWRDAATARDRAVEAEYRQSVEAARADSQSVRAEQARQDAEQQLYVNRIAFAQNACENDEPSRAAQLLEACPPERRGWEWFHLRRLSARDPLFTLRAHEGPAYGVAVSPDGRYAATFGADKQVRLWDLQNAREFRRLDDHNVAVNAIAFGPDGQRFFSADQKGVIRCFDIGGGGLAWVSRDFPPASTQPAPRIAGQPDCMAIRPDGTQLVVGTSLGDLVFIEAQTGKPLRCQKAFDDTPESRQSSERPAIKCVAYSPDGKYIATGEHRLHIYGDSYIRIWDASTGQEVRSICAHPAGVYCLAYSPDGNRLASGGAIPFGRGDAQGTLCVFDAHTGEQLVSTRGHEGYVNGLAFSPDGKLLASCGAPRSPYGETPDKTVKLWSAKTGAELGSFPAHQSCATGVAWTDKGHRLLSIGRDGFLRAWSKNVNVPFRAFEHELGCIRQVAFSPDGKRLVCGCALSRLDDPNYSSAVNRLQVWDVSTGRLLKSARPQTDPIFSLAWSPDGMTIALGDKSVRLWNADTLEEKFSFPFQAPVLNLAFSGDGQMLAAVSNKEAIVWKLPDWSPIFRRTEGNLRALAFSPDQQRLALGNVLGTIRLFELPSGRESRVIRTDSCLMAMAFSIDGRRLLCGHAEGTITAWDALRGERISTAPGGSRAIQSLSCSPDGKRFATTAADMLLRIWNVETVTELYATKAHDGAATCVRFSPDGKQIATCGQDTFIKIWESEVPTPAASQPASQPGAVAVR